MVLLKNWWYSTRDKVTALYDDGSTLLFDRYTFLSKLSYFVSTPKEEILLS